MLSFIYSNHTTFFQHADFTISLNHVNHEALKYVYVNQKTKGFFQFEIIINILVSSVRFISLPMLWVYNELKYFTHLLLKVTIQTIDIRIWRA